MIHYRGNWTVGEFIQGLIGLPILLYGAHLLFETRLGFTLCLWVSGALTVIALAGAIVAALSEGGGN